MFRTISGTVGAPPKSTSQYFLRQLRILPRTNPFARGDIADLQNYKHQRQKHTSFWRLRLSKLLELDQRISIVIPSSC